MMSMILLFTHLRFREKRQTNFDRMIQANIPGQNHDCSIIPDYGNG